MCSTKLMIPSGAIFLFLAVLNAPAKAQEATETGECWTACEPRPLNGFVKAYNSTAVNSTADFVGMQLFEENSTTPFRFVSVNAPNLHRLELSSSNPLLVGMPSRAEIFDLLCSVQQLGGQVVRGYVLSFGSDSTFHVQGQEPTQIIGQQNEEILPTLSFNEEWFVVLDSVLQVASTLGIRVVFPFINMVELEQWGGAASLSRWSNVSPQDFFSNAITKNLYKQVVDFVINRRNTLTGTLYRDDPAIFGWELGNELFAPRCENLSPPVCGVDRTIRSYPSVPVSWTEEMSDYIRELDPNHLIIDGAYPKDAEVMSLPNVDVVGATYYEASADQLMADVDFIGGKKAVLIKEFGLSGSSTLTTLEEILEVVVNKTDIAGALYWSLRGHHKDGGFYWHYEQSVDDSGETVYPASLHWPGFAAEAPTYENSVFEELRTASLAIGAPSPSDFVPCTPRVALLGGDFFPPCMALVGSTGASRYEIWVTQADGSELEEATVPYEEVQASWFRIQRDAHDAAAEQSAALSFFEDESVRTLLGWGGNAWRLCATACNKNGNCSACTAPLQLAMDVAAPIAPLCLTSFSNSTMAAEDVEYLGRYLFSMDRPRAWSIAVGLLATAALLCLFALLAICRSWVASACARAWSSYRAALLGRTPPQQADALCMGSQASFRWAGELAVLKALAVLLLILHCRRHDVAASAWPLSAVVEWGATSYSLLFLMAGFVLGSEQLRVGGSEELGSSAAALRCFGARVAHLGPPLVVACAAGFILAPDSLTGSYLLLPLGLSAWYPAIWENEVNSAGWVAGALAFNALLLLPVLDALRETKPSRRTQLWLLFFCWLATLWQANDAVGQRLFLLDRFLVAIFLRAFAPSFVAGVLLASLSHQRELRTPSLLRVPGGSGTAAGAMLLLFLVPLDNRFAAAWVRSGATLPLQALLLDGVASQDAASCLLAALRVPAPTDMWAVLMLQHCVWAAVASVTDASQALRWLLFGVSLPVVSAIVDALLCQPACRMLLGLLRQPSSAAQGSRAPEAPRASGEKLALYFSSLVVIVAAFCIAQFYDPWVTVWDLSGAEALASALERCSWILLAPAPALLMGLGGLLLYPAVLQPAATPLERQLLAEHAQTEHGSVPFKIHFRIVTRGNNPNLVLGNCESALQVLRSCGLPANRWCVEVVADNAMGLASKCDVTEIVVPADYAPPGGCKFKARALNFAVSASSAAHHDWIVHLDEETRFDADTVAHVFEHCRKQHAMVQAGAARFPSIGQGVIYYNKAGIENYLTALADTIRVADDYAKFALQYRMFRLPLIGMHGSFVVCCNSLQREVGWDWGMTGSITEDTYLAMKLAGMGVKFDFCGGNMYEQSPFSCLDFAKQRARWFSGLWLCVVTKTLPLWQRVFLGSHLASWSLCPLLTLVTWVNLLTIFPRTPQFVFLMSFVFSIPFWSYCLGFALGFSPSQFKHGRVEWLLLFVLHVTLIPVYTIMETYGVARGICDRKTYVGFHIVQKEGNLVKKTQLQREAQHELPAASEEPQGLADAEVVVDVSPPESLAASAALAGWRPLLSRPAEPLDLAQSALRPHACGAADSMLTAPAVPLPAGARSNLQACALALDSSPAAVIAACFAAFLRRYTRQEESLLGVWQPHQRLVALPLSTSPSMQSPLSALVSQVFNAMQAGRRFSTAIDLDDLMAEFGAEAKLFPATIALLDGSTDAEQTRWREKQQDITPLAVNCAAEGDALSLWALFDSRTLHAEAVDGLLSSFACFLAAALSRAPASPEPLTSLPLLSDGGRRAALHSFYEELHRDGAHCGGPATLAGLMEQRLEGARQEALAVEDPRSGEQLSYRELDQRTRFLASLLRRQYGIGRGDVVVVAAERKIGAVVSVLSVARTGAAYMPVDAAHPARRVRFMLRDAGVKLILCSAEQAPLWHAIVADATSPAPAIHAVEQDLRAAMAAAAMAEVDQCAPDPPTASDPAAVLYTSGSTGTPKAVVIPNGALVRQYAAIAHATGLRAGDRIAQHTTLTFDVAGNEVWGCMWAQGTLVVVDDDSRMLRFESFIAKHGINVLFITPSHLGVMSPSACGPSLKTLAVAGEAVPKALIDKWAACPRVFCNEYGPTETNVVSSLQCSPSMPHPASIGRPLPAVPLLVLDEFLEPVPLGVAGELCVGGAQVAAGYLNRPELTEAKFISWRDHGAADGASVHHRLYRTGDLCRWLPDGTLEFLGRIDSQVKLRGMRVEVGEIESTILSQPTVTQCAVLLLGAPSTPQLVAFVVVDEEQGAWKEGEVRAALAEALPEHMVPAAFQRLARMPATASGKIDRKALPPLWEAPATPLAAAAGAEEEGDLPALALGGAELSVGAFLASDRAKALLKRGVDSLGMMRQYRALVATEAFALEEARVVSGVRAVCMLGVIVDHLANCAPASPCTVVASKLLFPHAGSSASLRGLLLLLETAMRAVGGYKTIAGFSMASGYIDAGGASAHRLGMMEAAIAAIYLEMTWVWDPAVTAIADAAGEDGAYPWWLAQHRWYLLAMLLSRVGLVLLQALRVAPLLQVAVAALAMLLAPPSIGCVSAVCAGDGSQGWTDWGAAPQPLSWLLGVLFRGIEPQDPAWPYGGFRYALARKYLLMVLLYIISFHYGRAVIKAAVDGWKMVQGLWRSAVGNKSGAAGRLTLKLPSALAGALSLSTLALSSVWLAGEWGAEEDNWVQEWGAVRSEAHLTRLGLLTLALILQVLCLVAALAFLPIRLHLPGTTTLGAFIAHSYCNVVVSALLMNNAELSVPPALAYCTILLAAAAIQLVVGPVVHWAVVQHLLLLGRGLSWTLERLLPPPSAPTTAAPPPPAPHHVHGLAPAGAVQGEGQGAGGVGLPAERGSSASSASYQTMSSSLVVSSLQPSNA